MGHYSQLYIGEFYFSWKYEIPTFPTLLFEKEDIFIDELEEENGYLFFDFLGFKCETQKAIELLNRNGYSLNFFGDVFKTLDFKLHPEYIYSLEFEDDQDVRAHLNSFPKVSYEQQIEDFVKFIKALSKDPIPDEITFSDNESYDLKKPSNHSPVISGGNSKSLNSENLQMYILHKERHYPPWIIKLSKLFDWDYISDYPEIVNLMLMRIILEIVENDSNIELNLYDIFEIEEDEEPRQELEKLYDELSNELIKKINLYQRVFEPILENEEFIREKFIKNECQRLLKKCDSADNNHDKGRYLENLAELIFTSNNHFDLIDKRVSTGDEEIDLVLKNGMDRPFWNAFQSSLFFIECKNWSSPIEAKHVRDFEGKLRNHSKLVKVGFFVSLNGFTEGAITEMKRSGRDEYHIVLINREAILEYLESNTYIYQWLEQFTSKFY